MAESFQIFFQIVAAVVVLCVVVVFFKAFGGILFSLGITAAGVALMVWGLSLLFEVGGEVGAIGIILALLGLVIALAGVTITIGIIRDGDWG